MTATWKGALREHEVRLAAERAGRELDEGFREIVRLDNRDANASLRALVSQGLATLEPGDWRAASSVLLAACDDLRTLAHDEMTPGSRAVVDAMLGRIAAALRDAALETKAAA